MQLPNPIAWTPSGGIRLLDQTRLPGEERYLELDTVDAVAEAIASLRVRGAPLIGIAAAMGVTLAGGRLEDVRRAAATLGATRPTAVNLHWALRRMERRAERADAAGEPLDPALRAEAQAIWDEDRAMCDRIGALGAALVPAELHRRDDLQCRRPRHRRDRDRAGADLPSPPARPGAAGHRARDQAVAPGQPTHRLGAEPRGRRVHHRRRRRGRGRLRQGDVACALVGADRIAANGDVANKVGTYALALAARAHGVPLYVLAPSSTIDLAVPDGSAIPIELRSAEEVDGMARRARGGGRCPGMESRVRRHPRGAGERDRDRSRRRATGPALPPHGLMPSVLALDQGTTGSTALVIHQDGSVLGRGYREFTQYFPQPGWVEHDPEEIFRVSLEAIARRARRGRRAAGRRWGSPTSARQWCCGSVGRSRPVAPAIVWQDRRTSERCRELRESGVEAMLRRRTGPRGGSLLLGDQAGVAAARPRAAASRGEGRAGGRDGRELARGEAHRRPGARERPHQRQSHAALRSRFARLAP